MTTDTEIQTVLATVGSLAAALVETRQKRLEAEAHKPPWKPRRHYASSLSGCARQMVYAHTHWQEKEPFSPEGVAAMNDGNHEERLLIQELLEDGFEIVEQQVQLDDDRYWVTGKIDGKLKWQRRKIPFEVKRLKPFMFDSIESVDDLKGNPWLLKYLRQLTLYLFLHNEEAGLFIFSDGLGRRKFLPVSLDLGLAESILKDLDTANAALKDGTLPDRIPYSSKVCGYCPFRKVCLPDMDFGAGVVLGETELAQALARLDQLKDVVTEADQLKREVKKSVEGKPMILAGDFMVTGGYVERKMKASEARVDRFWKYEVEKLNGNSQEKAA